MIFNSFSKIISNPFPPIGYSQSDVRPIDVAIYSRKSHLNINPFPRVRHKVVGRLYIIWIVVRGRDAIPCCIMQFVHVPTTHPPPHTHTHFLCGQGTNLSVQKLLGINIASIPLSRKFRFTLNEVLVMVRFMDA